MEKPTGNALMTLLKENTNGARQLLSQTTLLSLMLGSFALLIANKNLPIRQMMPLANPGTLWKN